MQKNEDGQRPLEGTYTFYAGEGWKLKKAGLSQTREP